MQPALKGDYMLPKTELYDKFVKDFAYKLKKQVSENEYDKIIFFCIGTDRVTGDSFGPIVGYKLKYLFKDIEEVEIYGHLEENICANNANDIIKQIQSKYDRPFVIAIDSAISKKENIGKIVVENNGMYLGKALNKKINYVGDLSIKGIVSQNVNVPQYNFKLLQNTSLSLVMNMADVVSSGIYNVINI